jgi:dTDP-4-amino-4,6-dideoxygalactose transaminase
VLPTFCVRSCFDLFFQARKFPAGSEVIFTAVNIPDMVQVVTEHNLVPVPMDVDPTTMAPADIELFKSLIKPGKTVAFIGAYVYGIRYDPTPYLDICEENKIDYIEDVAQTYQGAEFWSGHPRAVLTMYSFGLIKV